MRKTLPWETRILEGDPYQLGGRELTPVVQMQSLFRRQVTFGTNNSSGYGGGLIWLKPIAVVERDTDGNERHIAIVDEAGMAIKGMLIAAAILPIAYAIVAGLASIWRRQRSTT
jgi:hypothetical protein